MTALQATENGASDDELRDLLAFRMMALDDAGACSGRVSWCRARDPASKDCSAQIHLERCADQPGPVDVMGLGERLDHHRYALAKTLAELGKIDDLLQNGEELGKRTANAIAQHTAAWSFLRAIALAGADQLAHVRRHAHGHDVVDRVHAPHHEHRRGHRGRRVHAQAAGLRVKDEGLDNDLLDRLKNDRAFWSASRGGPLSAELNWDDVMDPMKYVGRSVEQTERFIKEVVEPLREQYGEAIAKLGASGPKV